MLRNSTAILAPSLGFIDDFIVGGGSSLPATLLAADAQALGDVRAPRSSEVERVPGLSVPFCHYGLATFGHFVLDGLLQVFLNHAALISREARLAHWPMAHVWMTQGLDAVGVDAGRRHELRREAARFQTASLSSALAGHGVYFPSSLSRKFFAWLGEALDVATGASAGERLYIRRSDAFQRRITNKAELETLIKAYGFAVISPEDHTLTEQARFFAGAKVVLSPWGSGLTLAPLLPSGAQVIELLPETISDIWFLRQAAVHGLRYTPIVHASDAAGDITADLAEIESVLRELDD